MNELLSSDFNKALFLLEKVPFNNLFAQVVLDKKVIGRVFVDNYKHPTVCLIIHKYGMAMLCGNYKNKSFNTNLRSFLLNDLPNSNTAKWMLTYPDNWETILSELLDNNLILMNNNIEDTILNNYHDKYILQKERINFKYNTDSLINDYLLPEGYSLKLIDSAIYDKITGSVIPHSLWNNKNDFLQNGIGYSLLYENQVVSTCFAAFIVNKKFELGIETNESFRKKGFAYYPSIALIEYCLSNGYEPIWACRKDNIGSFKLAQKLGFQPQSSHPYYCIPLK